MKNEIEMRAAAVSMKGTRDGEIIMMMISRVSYLRMQGARWWGREGGGEKRRGRKCS